MNKLNDNIEDQYRLNHLWYSYEKMDSRSNNFKSFKEFSAKKLKSSYSTINNIIKNKNEKKRSKNVELNSSNDNDSSILNFEYFLLYIIRLYKNRNNKELYVPGEFNLNDLIDEYENEFNDKDSSYVIDFLDYMISMKNIYDRYIVKYDNNSESWSLGNKKLILIQSCLRVSFINRRLMHWIYATLKYFYQCKTNINDTSINQYISIMRNYIT